METTGETEKSVKWKNWLNRKIGYMEKLVEQKNS